MGGANSFDYIGRQLVSMAEADAGVGSLEVWAMERRTNCLEDLTGMNAAEAAGDPGIAVDYYYNGVEVAGKMFQGFLGEQDVPFLSEFGLKLLMDDIQKDHHRDDPLRGRSEGHASSLVGTRQGAVMPLISPVGTATGTSRQRMTRASTTAPA